MYVRLLHVHNSYRCMRVNVFVRCLRGVNGSMYNEYIDNTMDEKEMNV